MSLEHDHHHHSAGGEDKNLWIALGLNTLFALVEIFGGILTNSTAVLSDALHDAGDTVALTAALYFQKISGKKRDQHYSFGYRRFSVLGALLNGMILLVGSAIILYSAIPRLWNPEPVRESGMLGLAILGILVNAYAYYRLKNKANHNERMISLHLLEDALGWIAVLIISVILHFYNLPVLDPAVSIAITLFILFRLFGNLRQSFRILLQGNPLESLSDESIRNKILENSSAKGVHDLHIWTLDGSYNVATLHLEVEDYLSLDQTEELKYKVREILSSMDIQHATIEVEISGRNCGLNDC